MSIVQIAPTTKKTGPGKQVLGIQISRWMELSAGGPAPFGHDAGRGGRTALIARSQHASAPA